MNNWQARVITEKQQTPLPACQINGVHKGDMQMSKYELTEEEISIAELLGMAFNMFSKLETLHAADKSEFTQAIHQAQNIVLSRAGFRQIHDTNRPNTKTLRELRQELLGSMTVTIDGEERRIVLPGGDNE